MLLGGAVPVVATFGLSGAPVVLEQARDALGTSDAAVAWVLIAYTLAFGVLTPAMGKLADVYGTRLVLVLGAVLLAVGCGLCLTATGIVGVIAGRTIEGAGAAASSVAGFAIMAVRGHPDRRIRQLGVLTAGSCVVLGLGAFVGALVQDLGWRWVLALPMAAGVIGLLAAGYPGVHGLPSTRFDTRGALLVTTTSTATLAFIQCAAGGSGIASLLGLAAIAVGGGACAVRHARANPDGFVPTSVLGLAWMRRLFLAAAMLSAWSLGTTTLGPLLLADAEPGWSPVQIGAALLPAAVISATVALLAPRWPQQRRMEPLLAIAAGAGVTSGVVAAMIGGVGAPVLALASGTSAFAVSQVTVQGRLPSLVPSDSVGIAIGTLSLAVVLGGAAGTSFAVMLFDAIGDSWATAPLALLPLAGLVAATAGRRRI